MPLIFSNIDAGTAAGVCAATSSASRSASTALICLRSSSRLELLLKQIKAVEAERDALLVAAHTPAAVPASMLLNIKGIGPEFAAVLWSEGLFRHFDNRRQVAAYAGLAPPRG